MTDLIHLICFADSESAHQVEIAFSKKESIRKKSGKNGKNIDFGVVFPKIYRHKDFFFLAIFFTIVVVAS
jgi:hypothetical protein